MSDAQLIGALKAAVTRMFEHRRELRRVQTHLRLWPEGLVLSCNIVSQDQEKIAPGRLRAITWDDLATLTAEKAVLIANEVCAEARLQLRAGNLRVVR